MFDCSLKGSNHYGIAGYYALQALKENMIVGERFICLSTNFKYLQLFKLFK